MYANSYVHMYVILWEHCKRTVEMINVVYKSGKYIVVYVDTTDIQTCNVQDMYISASVNE